MEELVPPAPRHTAPDLASIVLATADHRTRRRRAVARERVQARTRPALDCRELHHEPTRRRSTALGSLVLLVLVVLTLVGMVVLAISIGRGEAGRGASALAEENRVLRSSGVDVLARTSVQVLDDATGAAAAAPRLTEGIDLVAGRVTAAPSASGGTIVRVAVLNRGTQAFGDGSDAEVVVLVDGAVMGSAPIGPVDARGGRGTVEVPLDDCTSGTRLLTVLLRSGDADAANDVSNRRLRVSC